LLLEPLMSVYTKVQSEELTDFLIRYSIGKLVSFSGITAGVTNTNYWLETDSGYYVLTLFEHLDSLGLDYVLGLQHHLANKGVKCTAPIIDNSGALFSILNHRPAAIINRISGSVYQSPTINQCHQIGSELAKFHLAGLSYQNEKPNNRGLKWMKSISIALKSVLEKTELDLINLVIKDFESFDLGSLPLGSLHGDLFHDNVLFDDGNLSGIIDFDYACQDYLIYDIAVTINDWCINSKGELLPDKMSAFLKAYNSIRVIQACEHSGLPLMLQTAALRFWLSRLYDKHFPLSGELTFVKDPSEFSRMLISRREGADLLTNTKT